MRRPEARPRQRLRRRARRPHPHHQREIPVRHQQAAQPNPLPAAQPHLPLGRLRRPLRRDQIPRIPTAAVRNLLPPIQPRTQIIQTPPQVPTELLAEPCRQQLQTQDRRRVADPPSRGPRTQVQIPLHRTRPHLRERRYVAFRRTVSEQLDTEVGERFRTPSICGPELGPAFFALSTSILNFGQCRGG